MVMAGDIWIQSPVLPETIRLPTLSPINGWGQDLLVFATPGLSMLPNTEGVPYTTVVATDPKEQTFPFARDMLRSRGQNTLQLSARLLCDLIRSY